MKFLIDVCADSKSLRDALAHMGYEFVRAAEIDPKAADDALLAIALSEQRVLLTEDKDFGELVFVRRLPHPCIVRFIEMRASDKGRVIAELINRHAGSMRPGTMIVVTQTRIRIRRNVPDSE